MEGVWRRWAKLKSLPWTAYTTPPPGTGPSHRPPPARQGPAACPAPYSCHAFRHIADISAALGKKAAAQHTERDARGGLKRLLAGGAEAGGPAPHPRPDAAAPAAKAVQPVRQPMPRVVDLRADQ